MKKIPILEIKGAKTIIKELRKKGANKEAAKLEAALKKDLERLKNGS